MVDKYEIVYYTIRHGTLNRIITSDEVDTTDSHDVPD